MTSGKFVETDASGKSFLVFKDEGRPARLPIPELFTSSDDWKNGKIRHVAAAIHQGMRGSTEERAAGERYLAAMAREQEAAGAWYLDVNVDEYSLELDEKIAAIEWVAALLQRHATVPLSIDSSDSRVLAAGPAGGDKSTGTPLVNSIPPHRPSMMPGAPTAGARVIAGATGEARMPEGVEERVANIRELMERLVAEGFALEDIYLDPLVMPVSVNTANGTVLIDAVRELRAEYGNSIHFAPGLSNVSFGLPKRPLINQVFAKLCLDAGCDGGIVDPAQINDRVLATLDLSSPQNALARDLLLGKDEYGMAWISACRDAQG
jgi:5-methyltetrahydrofolate--homocysteine methyltransferase